MKSKFLISIIVASFLIFYISLDSTIDGYSTPNVPIFTDKEVYSWTDKIHITVKTYGWNTEQHDLDSQGSQEGYFIKISNSKVSKKPYKLSKAGNGLYKGEIVLTGFLHDVDGDGQPDTNPRTSNNHPNNFLETKQDDRLRITLEFANGDSMSHSVLVNWNVGEIYFDKSTYTIDETAIIKLLDPDLNLNPESTDSFDVPIWSDTDLAGISLTVTETDIDSGIFEGSVIFSNIEKSSGNRLHISQDDTIIAQYEDHTLPKPSSISDELIISSIASIRETHISTHDEIVSPNVESPLDQSHLSIDDEKYPSPKKQVSQGIKPEAVICNEGLILIIKHNGSPACLKHETGKILETRGYGIMHHENAE